MTKLTILMYHEVASPGHGTRHRGNFVTPAQFEEQLDALTDWGYQSIGFDEWLAFRDGRGRVPRRPLIVTFDDGYRSFAEHAWPRLRARGMRATMFLVASQIGGTNVWDKDERSSPLLDADEILALASEGVDFGSHSWSHVPLAKVPLDVARRELTDSRALISELLGAPVRVLSYPYSNQGPAVRALARDTGYAAAVRGKGRMNFRLTDPHGLRRIKFDVHTSLDDARRELFRARWVRL